MQSKIAFITGITGQDGAYLAEFLLDKDYHVHGLVRWDAVDGTDRLKALGLADKITLHHGDMNDAACLIRLLKEIQPDEIYNLAALSHVAVSFETPASTMQANALGTLNLLEAIRILELQRDVRLYQASSSEMFGKALAPQNERTPFAPCSPYGVAKLAGYEMARVYRDAYGVQVSNGILFNHESPLRGEDFVTAKIVNAAVAIAAGQQDSLALGNLDAMRDWGHARDYVRGMWMMLQHDSADDFVLATGIARRVRDFVCSAFHAVGIEITWQGEGVQEAGINAQNGKVLVRVDPAFFRPQEVHHLLGDATKAKNILGWAPHIKFDDLVKDMIAQAQNKTGGASWAKAG